MLFHILKRILFLSATHSLRFTNFHNKGGPRRPGSSKERNKIQAHCFQSGRQLYNWKQRWNWRLGVLLFCSMRDTRRPVQQGGAQRIEKTAPAFLQRCLQFLQCRETNFTALVRSGHLTATSTKSRCVDEQIFKDICEIKSQQIS